MIAGSYHQSVRKTRKNKNVVHMTIGLHKEVRSSNDTLNSNLTNQRRSSVTRNQIQRSSLNVKKIHRKHPFSSQLNKNRISPTKLPLQGLNSMKNIHISRVSNVSLPENKNDLSDHTVETNDNLKKSTENQKKKCVNPSFIGSLVLISLIVLTITGILLGILITPKGVTSITTPVLRWNMTGITVAGISNSPGNTNDQLDGPTDVALDYANNLYVADSYNHRIQKFSSGSSTGQTIAGNGTLGNSSSQLNSPNGIIIDLNGDFYITDKDNQRVLYWCNGAVNGTVVAGVTGISGNATNELNTPYRTILHPTSGTLYIADTFNQRIMSYTSGTNNGTLVFGGNGGGTDTDQLYYPIGLYLDSLSNSLVIANLLAHNIVRYVLNAINWTLVAGNINGTAGVTSTEFNSPFDVTFDPMGNMYVADRENHRIQFFYAGQSNGTTIAGITGVNGSNATTLYRPKSIKLDSQLNLYVADAFNHRIQKFLRY